MMLITSKNNPLIKETAYLKDKKGRKEHRLFLVEGIKMTAECQKSALEIERIFLAERLVNDGVSSLDKQEKTVLVSDDVLRFLSDEKTPQGVLCRVKIPDTTPKAPTGSCVVLDGVADPGNVGTIIRTANAAGYNDVYLTSDCADVFSPKCVRASMSGVFFTNIHIGTREEIFKALGDTPIIVADMNGQNAFSFPSPKNFALVIGNEANGVSEETAKKASFTVKIPMRETQESLNAGVSAGILMYLLKKETFL